MSLTSSRSVLKFGDFLLCWAMLIWIRLQLQVDTLWYMWRLQMLLLTRINNPSWLLSIYTGMCPANKGYGMRKFEVLIEYWHKIELEVWYSSQLSVKNCICRCHLLMYGSLWVCTDEDNFRFHLQIKEWSGISPRRTSKLYLAVHLVCLSKLWRCTQLPRFGIWLELPEFRVQLQIHAKSSTNKPLLTFILIDIEDAKGLCSIQDVW